MICDKCHKRIATVEITKIVGNKQIKLYLCEKCASDAETMIINYNSFQQFLSGLLNVSSSIKNNVIQCNKCGMTIDEFKKTSKIGCDNCYDTFKEYLTPLFKRIHGSVTHEGKRPKKLEGEMKAINEINKMQEDLKKAILSEEYEEAARLRDLIKQIKKEAGM